MGAENPDYYSACAFNEFRFSRNPHISDETRERLREIARMSFLSATAFPQLDSPRKLGQIGLKD